MSDEWTEVKKSSVNGRPRGMGAPKEDGSSNNNTFSAPIGPVGSASYAHHKNSKPQSRGPGINTSVPGAQVEQKFNAGHNKQKAPLVTNARKLEEEDEDFHVNRVGREVAMKIQQARTEKNMTRSELANAINEKVSVLSEIENGNAVMNLAIIAKIERALGTTVRLGKKKAKKIVTQIN
ncbi:multiprotein-bridging factor [Acrasis kona]|uniref:Multiprotein-bridging factor n=1 Tax=Acrasis kona TaxID=1008807 RepID=A0AAW2ZKV4_9EUKA